MKHDFRPFKIGTVFNPLKHMVGLTKPVRRLVSVKFPSRLNAMALDPSKIAENQNMVYSPGEMLFSVQIYITVRAEITSNNGEIKISESSKCPSLIKHSVLLMQKALGFKEGLHIDVENEHELKHCGFGSSSRLIPAVAATINELYGKPLSANELVRYLAQNHGEEIDNDAEMISPVQCIGGSASSGFNLGGLQVIAGDSTLVKAMRIPDSESVLVGVPVDFVGLDAQTLLEKEMENLPKFIYTGKTYGKEIAYRILHEVLPAMVDGDLGKVGDLIFDYRFKMGSIGNCSFVYPRMVDIAERLAFLKETKQVSVLAISSVGPAFFAIVPGAGRDICLKEFEQQGLKVIETKIENGTYSTS